MGNLLNIFIKSDRSQFLLQFKYSDQTNSFEFISAIDLGEKIDYFMRVYENNYLFLLLDKNDGHKFCVKKILDNQVGKFFIFKNILILKQFFLLS